jgi:hypothetical protein
VMAWARKKPARTSSRRSLARTEPSTPKRPSLKKPETSGSMPAAKPGAACDAAPLGSNALAHSHLHGDELADHKHCGRNRDERELISRGKRSAGIFRT